MKADGGEEENEAECLGFIMIPVAEASKRVNSKS